MATRTQSFNGTFAATTLQGNLASTYLTTSAPGAAYSTGSTISIGALPNTYGGTGQNSSAWSGLVSVNAGVWSAGSYTVPSGNGGTGTSTIGTGMVKANGASAMTAITATANGVGYWSDSSTIASTAVGTAGQILVGNGASAPTWLSAGTNGQLLIGVTGSSPSWSTISSGVVQSTGTAINSATGTKYGVTYWSNTGTIASTAAPTTTGQILYGTLNGAPTWGTVPSGNGNVFVISGGVPTWQSISAGIVKTDGTTLSNNTGTANALAYWNTTTTLGSLAGTAGQLLVGTAGAPSWSSVSAGVIQTNGTALNNATGTQYGLTYWSTTTGINSTGAGGAGDLLVGNGAAAPGYNSVSNGIVKRVTGTSNAYYSATTGTAYMLARWTSTGQDLTSISAGTTGAVLMSNGGSAAPSFTTVSQGIVKSTASGAISTTGITSTQWGVSYWDTAQTISGTLASTGNQILIGNSGSAPTWGVVNSNVLTVGTNLSWAGNTLNATGDVASTPNTVVQRDTLGAEFIRGETLDNPGTSAVTFSSFANTAFYPGLGDCTAKTGTLMISTSNAVATDAIIFAMGANYPMFVTLEILVNLATSDSALTSTGSMYYIQRFKVVSNAQAGYVIAANPMTLLIDLDAALAGCTIGMINTSTPSAKVQITGIGSTAIRWQICYKILHCNRAGL